MEPVTAALRGMVLLVEMEHSDPRVVVTIVVVIPAPIPLPVPVGTTELHPLTRFAAS
jgi:threonine/homoserine efflux transporter RhtA